MQKNHSKVHWDSSPCDADADIEGLSHNFYALREDTKGRGLLGQNTTPKKLEAIEESNSQMDSLVVSTSSSNGVIVSNSEGEDTLTCS